MNFLKTLMWIFVAAVLAIFSAGNWHDVTLSLWGGLLLTIKLPLLLLIVFLLGWLPTWLIMRGRLWRVRRLGPDGNPGRPVPAPPPAPSESDEMEQAS